MSSSTRLLASFVWLVVLATPAISRSEGGREPAPSITSPWPNDHPETPTPRLTFVSASVDDSLVGLGNANAILEPGETADVTIRIYNMGTATAWSVDGALKSDELGLTLPVRIAGFGDVLPGGIVSSSSPTFRVSLPASVPCGKNVHFTLTLLANGYQIALGFDLPLRGATPRLGSTFSEDSVVYGFDVQDRLGYEVATGDLNGDGYDDLAASAQSDGPSNGRTDSGEVWVLRGGPGGLPGTVDLRASPAGTTVVYGADAGDWLYSVAMGDLDGDGYDDLVVGATSADGPSNARPNAGEVWVLYGGSAGLPSSVDLASPPSGSFVVYGADAGDLVGQSLGVGDLNGDGFDDLIIGGEGGGGPSNGRPGAGEVWVLYGESRRQTVPIDLAAPPAGLSVVFGADSNDLLASIGSGDLDMDGYDDLLIGARLGDGPGEGRPNAGEVWVLYGDSSGLPSSVDLAAPPGASLVVYGSGAFDEAGTHVSAGDLNGDGFDELILSAPLAAGPSSAYTWKGEVWVLYGGSVRSTGSVDLATPPSAVSVVWGLRTDHKTEKAIASDLNADGYDDLIVALPFTNSPPYSAGEVWVLHGGKDGLPESIDLATPPVAAEVVYGADTGDENGRALAAGDFDRNGIQDLVLGAPLAGGPGNARLAAGELLLLSGRPTQHHHVDSDTFSFIDATSGTNLGLSCDSCLVPASIGFPFDFYGRSYTNLWVADDGYVVFSANGFPSPLRYCMPNDKLPNDIVAAFWDDLYPPAGGAVYTLLEGTAPNRRFTIEWSGVPIYPGTGAGTFEITLFESTSQILVQYQDTLFGTAADSGSTAVAGIENSIGRLGQTYSCKSANLLDSTAWRVIPFGTYRLYGDDMESGANGWTPSGVWHQETAGSCGPESRSPGTSWYYGLSSPTCQYQSSTNAVLVSPLFAADYYSYLRYWFRREAEQVPFERSYVLVSESGGPMTQIQEQTWGSKNGAGVFTVGDGTWRPSAVDLSASSGNPINLGFQMISDGSIEYLGWMVDDVEIWGCDVYGTNPIVSLAYAHPAPVCEMTSYALDGTGTFAQGCSMLDYQWFENGSPLAGATSLNHTVPAGHAPGTFSYTLEATCSSDPGQTAVSAPVAVEVVPMPTEVSSLRLEKRSSGSQIHMSWDDVAGATRYPVFSDTVASGAFTTIEATGTSGVAGVDVPMAPDNVIFYRVAGENDTCGTGPK